MSAASTPCIKVCVIDPQTRLCEGCGRTLAEIGGHATLIRAEAKSRAQIDVFQPLDAPLMSLTAGLKRAFDPVGILNPGRMYAGI